MGFFSSRKAEDSENHLTPATDANHDKSVVNAIRSRFYGKNKGKEREEQSASFTTHGPSSAQTLSNPPIPTSTRITIVSSPLAGSAAAIRSAGSPGILRGQHDRSGSVTPSRGTRPATTMAPPPSPSPSSRSRTGLSVPRKSSNLTPFPSGRATDTVTVTLAQRLNELAVANSEGLLNDDEYRLLRQNLFERFASSAVVPTEAPVVPVARARPRAQDSRPDARPISRPLSNFQVEIGRSPSIRSKSSITSGVANFLRRATSRRTPSGSKDYSDSSSIFSTASTTSNIFNRGLSKQSSISSVRTASRAPDAMSISSRQTGIGSDRTHSDMSAHPPSSISRSTNSVRRMATPPSSFPTRALGGEGRYSGNINDVFDDERLETAQQIRDEILMVEAEAKRLMDAFNGLELTTLARVQRRQGRQPLQTSTEDNSADPTWGMSQDVRPRRAAMIDSDVASFRSTTSAGTSPSVSRSVYSARKIARPRGSLNHSVLMGSASRSGSLHRKNSSSSVASQERKTGKGGVPPVPALPTTMAHGQLGVSNGSNVSLTRSNGHLPMSAVPEDEQPMPGATMQGPQEIQLENEMEDIRRRREEVSLRYEGKLEYLRAKLKGAQLHERLMKK